MTSISSPVSNVESMKSYFVAALSFVGVLGTAGAAMAVNADTLGISGGNALTGASSSTLISTEHLSDAVTAKSSALPTPSPSASMRVTTLSFGSTNGTTGGSTAGSKTTTASGAHKAVNTTTRGTTNGTTGGSAAGSSSASSSTPAKKSTSASSSSSSRTPVHAVTSGSSASGSSSASSSAGASSSTTGGQSGAGSTGTSGSSSPRHRDSYQSGEIHDNNGADD